ncbi:hypothetical protein K435DRAFT_859253 [Dendrothele bispora CBS 962.96]|uniref:Uncharacterized protein n=1 Tax=Dendrothele bispora (strain CBS 962.96) TaxID=1314807 RepID=A0A4S8M0Z7_DENBC|nr:hypothetical protein K435DRAFT_859253 [Dendrothele bispora CBS 962.96]
MESASGIQPGSFNDGRESDDDLLPISTPTGPNVSPALLLDALRSSQLQNQELRARCTALRKINADLQAQLQIKVHSGRGRKAKQADIPFQDQLVLYDIAELHDYLGDVPDLKHAAETLPGFRDEVVKQVGNERSVSLKTLRDNAIYIFCTLDVPSTIWKAAAGAERAKLSILMSLLLEPGKSLVKSTFAPVLYHNCDIRSTHLFMNEYQPKIIRVALFGGGAIQADPEAFRYTGGLLGMMWGVNRVNASLIAWSAMILRFLLSADQVLQETGAVTKIAYRTDFFKYCQMIIKHEHLESDFGKQLFKFYNKRVFVGLPSAGPESDAENFDGLNEIDEMTDLMDRLSAPGAGDLNPPNTPLVTTISPLPSEVSIAPVIEAEHTNLESHAVSPSPTAPTPVPAPRGRRGRPRSSPQVPTEVDSSVEPAPVAPIRNTRRTARK